VNKLAIATIFSLMITGCVTAPPPKDYSKFNAAGIRSILVIPVVNNSVEVLASDYFLSTVPIPVAENGYYVFPVNLVKRILEDDGLSDANLVHAASTTKLCELFGADAALYITIKRWDAQYIVISTSVTVELTYVLKDRVAGEEIWRDEQTMVYAPQGSGSGNPLADIIAMAIMAAITKANPNYIPLAQQANQKAFAYPGPGFPYGPYAKSKEKPTNKNSEKKLDSVE
jgi:hypothetical protein